MPEIRLPPDSAYFFAKLSESQDRIRQLLLSRCQAADARLCAPSSAGIPTARSTGLLDRRFSTDGRHGGIPITMAVADMPVMVAKSTVGRQRTA
jgi:hypothetical protein